MEYISMDYTYGHIYGFVNGRGSTITSLYIDSEFRNQGYGKKLLELFLTEAFSYNALHVELDDCSDNYRKQHNIYIKYGFKYDNNDNHMYGNVRNCLKLLKKN